jgi:NAD+ kinase
VTAPRVLVIYKKTAYQRYRGGVSKRLSRLLEEGNISVARLLEAHEAHLDTLERARVALKDLGAKASFRHNHEPNGENWDLVVTLGGDGTLLWSSHMVGADTPMLAINSAPESSVGYFCAADRGDEHRVLGAALRGELKRTRLTRMRVALDGEVISERVLNDVLFCHECPAATTRYVIRYGDLEEHQTSSGIWGGPAAGSTAAQRSAGGRVLPIGSMKLQWVVREPYRGPGRTYELARGLVDPERYLSITSKMREGKLYLDGAQKVHPVDIGTEIRLCRSPEPLTLLGLRSRERP